MFAILEILHQIISKYESVNGDPQQFLHTLFDRKAIRKQQFYFFNDLF